LSERISVSISSLASNGVSVGEENISVRTSIKREIIEGTKSNKCGAARTFKLVSNVIENHYWRYERKYVKFLYLRRRSFEAK
jgi:hypothetical protein